MDILQYINENYPDQWERLNDYASSDGFLDDIDKIVMDEGVAEDLAKEIAIDRIAEDPDNIAWDY